MSVNSLARKHHPNVRPGLNWNLFYKIDSKRFRLWDEAADPSPVYQADLENESGASDNIELQEDEHENNLDADGQDARQFAFEKDLQNFLARNLSLLEPGLKLYRDDDGELDGIEFPADQRFIDILCKGDDGAFVVVELKVSRAYDRVIGQLLRYMAWVQENMADTVPVRGIIVASKINRDLKLAAKLIPNVQLVEYEISFSINPLPQ